MSSTFLLIGKIILEVSHSVIRAALCHPFHCSCYFVVPAFEFSSLTFWYRIAIPLKNCNNKLQHNLNYKNAKHSGIFAQLVSIGGLLGRVNIDLNIEIYIWVPKMAKHRAANLLSSRVKRIKHFQEFLLDEEEEDEEAGGSAACRDYQVRV